MEVYECNDLFKVGECTISNNIIEFSVVSVFVYKGSSVKCLNLAQVMLI